MTTIGDRYDLAERIGSGAMGDVYRATDAQTDETVAVKHLKPDLLRHDPDLLTRFQREGEALRDLNHPNIVTLLDVVSENDAHYLVMEYVPGGDLSALIADSPGGLPTERVLNIALDLADALTRAHRLDIIHRDLKPANVLIAKDGTPRLSDFGIALHRDGVRLTDSQSIIGTMDYIAPEAINGQPIDTRADIWSFGVMIFEMLAGHRPFRGDTLPALFMAILRDPVPDLEAIRSDCPIALVDLVYRMLDKAPLARIPSVRYVGAALEDILHNRAQPLTGSRFSEPAPERVIVRSSNLPTQATPFVGRTNELDTLSRLLSTDSQRLVTILGYGGMGKSRLAVEVGSRLLDQFKHGAFFVELAKISDPANIPAAIAEATGFVFTQQTPQAEQILSFLSSRSMLLILDNFEHVLDGRDLVSDILSDCPDVVLLTTSRERLNLLEETVFNLDPLDFPTWETPDDALDYAAVQLFMQSARRVRASFELQPDDLDRLARICRLTEGIPLAILLAAAWVDTLSLAEIADEIQTNVDFLESAMANLPARHRSTRAAFDHSWQLLADEERMAFARMSVFRGGFTRQAAQAVTGTSLRMLTTLVNKSLLRRDQATGRFAIHELLRQFGEERLTEAGEAANLQEGHARYFTEQAEEAEPHLLGGPQQLDWLRRLKTEHDNLRTALEWAFSGGESDIGYRLVGALPFFWFRHDLHQEMGHWAETALKGGPDAIPADLRGGVLFAHGHYLYLTVQRDMAISQLAQAAELCTQYDQPIRAAFARIIMNSLIGLQPKRSDEARAAVEAIQHEMEAIGFQPGVAFAMNIVGNIWSYVDQNAKAIAVYEELLAFAVESGDRLRAVIQYGNLAANYARSGQLELAERRVYQFMVNAAEMGLIAMLLHAIVYWAETKIAQGQTELAARIHGMYVSAREETGILPQAQTVTTFAQDQESLQALLGAETYQTHFDRGYALSLDESVAFLLHLGETGQPPDSH